MSPGGPYSQKRNLTMQKLLSYLENTDFVQWVYKPDVDNTAFWTNYQRNNPDEVKLIQDARIILLQLKAKTTVPQQSIDAGFPQILKKIKQKKRRLQLRYYSMQSLKYAAIAVLFFTVGYMLLENRYHQSLLELNRQFASSSVFNGQESRLILTDGKNLIINQKFSQVKYTQDGSIILNEQDTITQNLTITENVLNQLIVPYGKNSAITLSDGTIAYLNAGSRLIFPPAFNGENREVSLIGEGYFEVAHNPARPFVVNTTDVDVEAVGTSFNVSAYPTDNNIDVVLTDGIVNINQKSLKFFHATERMVPQERVQYDKKTGYFNKDRVKTSTFTSWHKGYIDAESIELSEVTQKLERYYDVNIYFKQQETAHKKITGKLMLHEDIENILQVLSTTSTLKITKINEHEYLLN